MMLCFVTCDILTPSRFVRHSQRRVGFQSTQTVYLGTDKKQAKQIFYLRLYGVEHNMVNSERERERNVLFNDALNTFYLRLYGVRHMVKDHSDSEKGNPLPPHRLLLSINSKGSFICTIPPLTARQITAATISWATFFSDFQQGTFICTIPQTG